MGTLEHIPGTWGSSLVKHGANMSRVRDAIASEDPEKEQHTDMKVSPANNAGMMLMHSAMVSSHTDIWDKASEVAVAAPSEVKMACRCHVDYVWMCKAGPPPQADAMLMYWDDPSVAKMECQFRADVMSK